MDADVNVSTSTPVDSVSNEPEQDSQCAGSMVLDMQLVLLEENGQMLLPLIFEPGCMPSVSKTL